MRVRVVVTGVVQGVWFRERCRREAAALGVAGFVRNTEDGRVEGEFEGTPARVARLVDWCRTGPPRARVDDVAVETIEAIGDAGFRVR